MAIAQAHNRLNDTQNLLVSFANSQLSHIDTPSIKKNSFQIFSITAFLYGALNQLGKQSTLSEQIITEIMHNVLCEAFKIPQYNSEGLVNSIHRMMDKYYLLENIYHAGESAAERWLTSDSADCLDLKNLLAQYQDFTLLDMNSAGMKADTILPSVPEHHTENTNSTPKSASSSAKLILVALVLAMAGLGVYGYLFYVTPSP